jgi:hypothetical protein
MYFNHEPPAIAVGVGVAGGWPCISSLGESLVPKGPQGQKRPGVVAGAAIMVAAGVVKSLWTMEDIAEWIEARRSEQGKRGPYKKRQAA